MPDSHLGRPNTGAVWPGGPSKQGPHRIGSFCICPQYEAYAHELFLRPVLEKSPPKIGTLVHVGLAYRYAALLPQKPSWMVYPDGRHAIWACGADRPDLREVALYLFDHYQAYYGPSTWQPLLVEHQLEVTLVGEPYTARLDLLAIEDGEIILPDHKCKGYIKRETGYEYRSDRQMMTCLALARAHGFDVKRVVINAIRMPKPNNMGFYDLDHFTPRFARFNVPISAIAYGRLWDDTVWALENMKAVRKQYPDPMNRPRVWDNCIRAYGPCDFVPLCNDGPEQLVNFTKRT